MTAPGDSPGAPGRLAVVVLNWNNARDTIKCLESLASWASIKPDVYVVDNASTDGSIEEVRRRFPAAKVIMSPKNQGFAGGNNLAIKKAMEDGAGEIFLLNNDATLAEAAVLRLRAALHDRPDIAAIGPRLRVGEAILAGGYDIGRFTDPHIHWGPGMGTSGIMNVDYIPGTAFLIRTSVFKEVGLLDEAYFFSGEIADLCRRIKITGMICAIDLGADAVHRVDRSSQLNDMLHVYYSRRNRFLYVKKHYKSERLGLYGKWIRYCLSDLARSAVGRKPGRPKAIILALYDGVAGNFGDKNYRFTA